MKYLFGILIFTFFFSLGGVALGAETGDTPKPYVPMVGVPGLAQAGSYTAEMYVDALYKLAITLGGILAVIQIIFGGVMYMFDGSITNKEVGKDKIKGALFGLLIILGAVLLLQTINPDLLNLKIFNNAPSIDQIKGPVKNDTIPSHLKPNENQTLTLIPCGSNTGLQQCTSANALCKASGGTANISNVINGKLACYKPKTILPSPCDGYFEPQTKTCFGKDKGTPINLGSDFTNQPGQVREIECQRLNGSYDYKTGLCFD